MPWKLQLKEAKGKQNIFKTFLLKHFKEEIKDCPNPTNF
jgi:hypothetical protein